MPSSLCLRRLVRPEPAPVEVPLIRANEPAGFRRYARARLAKTRFIDVIMKGAVSVPLRFMLGGFPKDVAPAYGYVADQKHGGRTHAPPGSGLSLLRTNMDAIIVFTIRIPSPSPAMPPHQSTHFGNSLPFPDLAARKAARPGIASPPPHSWGSASVPDPGLATCAPS